MPSGLSPAHPSFCHEPSSAGSTTPLSQYLPKSSTGTQDVRTSEQATHSQSRFMWAPVLLYLAMREGSETGSARCGPCTVVHSEGKRGADWLAGSFTVRRGRTGQR